VFVNIVLQAGFLFALDQVGGSISTSWDKGVRGVEHWNQIVQALLSA
jgi:hypothetical protein